tara:strand:- start:869 stop:1639 length:771 start_codon:yes stop_codon:yes gene_type:complete
MLKITFLGTGTSQGVPVIGSSHPVCLSSNPKDKRLRVSVSVSWDKNTYIIDCGPDFRQQMLFNNINKINGILFTHEHADHTSGLDDIRPFFFKQGNIPIYAQKRVLTSLKNRFDYIFNSKNKYPGTPSLDVNEIIFDSPFFINLEKIIPIKVMHNKLSVMGYRIRNFAYLTDVKSLNENQFNKMLNLDVLVINALKNESHLSHLSLNEAIEIIKVLSPKRAYITHISHLLGFHDEVEKKLPKNINLAYDNLKIIST